MTSFYNKNGYVSIYVGTSKPMVGSVNFVVFVIVAIYANVMLMFLETNEKTIIPTYVFIFELIPQFGKLSKGGFISVDSRLTS